jgi:hypothetical protein
MPAYYTIEERQTERGQILAVDIYLDADGDLAFSYSEACRRRIITIAHEDFPAVLAAVQALVAEGSK